MNESVKKTTENAENTEISYYALLSGLQLNITFPEVIRLSPVYRIIFINIEAGLKSLCSVV
jgi:hypothetical protein